MSEFVQNGFVVNENGIPLVREGDVLTVKNGVPRTADGRIAIEFSPPTYWSNGWPITVRGKVAVMSAP